MQNSVPTRQKADTLLLLKTEDLGDLALPFTSDIRKVSGYSTITALVISDVPVSLTVRESCEETGANTAQTQGFSSSVDLSTGLNFISKRFSPYALFALFLLSFTGAPTSLSVCILGLPESGGGASGSDNAGIAGPYSWGRMTGVPGAGLRVLEGPGRTAAEVDVVRDGKIRMAWVRVDVVDATRTYDLEIVVNGLVVATVPLPINTLSARSVTLSVSVSVADRVGTQVRRTSGSGPSTFGEIRAGVGIL